MASSKYDGKSGICLIESTVLNANQGIIFHFSNFCCSFFPLLSGVMTYSTAKVKKMCRKVVISITPMKPCLNCKGRKLTGLISSSQEEFESADLRLNFFFRTGEFYCMIGCIVRILTRNVVELSFDTTYMIVCCKWAGGPYPTLLLIDYSTRYNKGCGRSVSHLYPFFG